MIASATTDTPADISTPEAPASRSRRFGVASLALAIVVGLLLGYAAGWITPRLTRPGNDSAEAGFARDMTTHHAQAVEMGLRALQSATDPEVRQLGMDIASSQQGDIGIMQSWLRSWGLDPSRSGPPMAWMPDGPATVRDGLMPGMATPAEMASLHAASGTELDVLFLELMRDHHLGGIHMVDAILDVSGNDEVRAVATTMKNTQRTELANIQNLLARFGG